MYYQINYLNILNYILLACPLYLIVAKYLTTKVKKEGKVHILFA